VLLRAQNFQRFGTILQYFRFRMAFHDVLH
jgi:hypothetical protein